MAEAPLEISKPKLLIGEGVEEVRFFQAMLRHLGIEDILVEQYGGKQKLASFIKSLPVRPGFASLASIGVTRDADESADDALQSVSDALERAELPAPRTYGKAVGASPRVDVFILPDGASEGMLEDLCLRAVQSDPAMPCVDEYMKCVNANAPRQTSSVSKARVRVWLASRTRPDLRLGEAADQGYWPWAADEFDQIKQFVQSL